MIDRCGQKSEPQSEADHRVLHILEATLGGTMRYIRDLAEASEGSSITFGFAYGTERADHQLPLFLDRGRELGWKLYPVSMVRRISPLRDARSLVTLVQVMRSFRPSVVHCHSSKAGAVGRLAALAIWPRPVVIYSPHSIMVGNSKCLLWIERALAKVTHYFVGSTKSECDQLVALGVAPTTRTRVITPFMDTEAFDPEQTVAAYRDADSPFHLVAVGRLSEQKRPFDFLRVVSATRAFVPAVTATWVGDGELRERFEQERRALNLDKAVMLTGWVEDVRPYLAAADVLLSTSAWESFGYMVAEGMAMGLLIVATFIVGTVDIGGEREIMFYPVGGIDYAAEALLSLYKDLPTAKRRGHANREYIKEQFSKEAMRAALVSCYINPKP